jgi:uncharacterized OsmC-like protein
MSAAVMRYEVEARITGPGRSELACKQSRIAFDSSPAQSDELPGPAELLAGAFAACLLKNVERFAEILPFHHAGAWVRVVVEREDALPRFARLGYEMRVITDEDPSPVELLHQNLRKFGTVYNTLASACEVSGDLIADRHERAQESMPASHQA